MCKLIRRQDARDLIMLCRAGRQTDRQIPGDVKMQLKTDAPTWTGQLSKPRRIHSSLRHSKPSEMLNYTRGLLSLPETSLSRLEHSQNMQRKI